MTGTEVSQVNTHKTDNYKECPPRAASRILLLRPFRYDLAVAIAGLADKIIFSESSNIRINYAWNDLISLMQIMHDGSGMTEERLVKAMGSETSSQNEDGDPRNLRRLGVKAASFYQDNFLSVSTKSPDDVNSTRCWDLYYVQKSQNLFLGKILCADVMKTVQI